MISTLQYLITNVGGYYITRLLLGLGEAGFIPASLFILSMWYKRCETSKRFTIFYFGIFGAEGATSLLAYGTFHMDGIAGLYGFQWMFIIMGLFTILCGIGLVLFLPKDPIHAWPLSGISYFTSRERDIMRRRILEDDASKERRIDHVTVKEITTTVRPELKPMVWAWLTDLTLKLTTWWIYPHLFISMGAIGVVSSLGLYAPSLVRGFGYGKLKSNALVSIGGWLQIPLSLGLGIIS